jgi:hypothetical protein
MYTRDPHLGERDPACWLFRAALSPEPIYIGCSWVVARMSTNSAAHDFHVLALRQSTIMRFPFALPIHLPASLCSTPITALPSSYEGSVSRLPFTRAAGYPRFTASDHVLSFRLQPPHVPPCTLSSHTRLFSRSGLFPVGPFPVCVHRVSGLRHITSGLARIIRPNRVPYRTDQ